MPNPSPQNPDKPDDVAGDGSMKDEGRRRWLYLAVKVFVLLVVAVCLAGANVVGGRYYRMTEDIARGVYCEIPFGWPLEYMSIDVPGWYYIRPMNSTNLWLNVAIAIILLCYLNHVITVFHRKWKPT